MLTDYVDPDTFTRICAHMRHENALAVQVSLETGLRIGDVVSLPISALDGNTLFFTAAKTGKSGKKKISATLAKRLREIAGTRYIFEGRYGADTHRTRQTVWTDIKKAASECGCKSNVSPHSARKTYAVELFHSGGLGAVRRELQHDDYSTSLIYAMSDKISCTPPCGDTAFSDSDIDRLAHRIADIIVLRLQDNNIKSP